MGLEWEALICMFYFRQYLGICIKFTVRGLHYNPCGTEMMSSTPHEAQSVQIVTALVILHMKIWIRHVCEMSFQIAGLKKVTRVSVGTAGTQ